MIFICFMMVVLPAPAGPSRRSLKLELKLLAHMAALLSSSLLQFLNGSLGLKQEKDFMMRSDQIELVRLVALLPSMVLIDFR